MLAEPRLRPATIHVTRARRFLLLPITAATSPRGISLMLAAGPTFAREAAIKNPPQSNPGVAAATRGTTPGPGLC